MSTLIADKRGAGYPGLTAGCGKQQRVLDQDAVIVACVSEEGWRRVAVDVEVAGVVCDLIRSRVRSEEQLLVARAGHLGVQGQQWVGGGEEVGSGAVSGERVGLFGVFEFVAGGSRCGEESSGREPEDSDLVGIDIPLLGVCPDRTDGSSDVGFHGLDAIEVACGLGGAELEYDSNDVVRGEESSEVVAFLVDHDPRQSTSGADNDCGQSVSCPSVGQVDGQGGSMDVMDASVDDRLAVASFDNRFVFGDAVGSGWCIGPERDGENFGVCVSGRACEQQECCDELVHVGVHCAEWLPAGTAGVVVPAVYWVV